MNLFRNNFESKIIFKAIVLSATCNKIMKLIFSGPGTHVNMVTLKTNFYVTTDTRRVVEVQSFFLQYKTLQKVSIADASQKHKRETYLLAPKNSLFVLAMKHALINFFFAR